MASRRYVLVWREHLLASDKWHVLDGPTRAAYLFTLCILTKADPSSRLYGCVCAGASPKTFEEWCVDIGFPRRASGRKAWDALFRVGLFEWREINGARFVHLYQFEEHQRQPGAPASAERMQRIPPTTSTKADGRAPPGNVGDIISAALAGGVTVWNATVEELVEQCAAIDTAHPPDRAAALWRHRVAALQQNPGGIDYLRECINEIQQGERPAKGLRAKGAPAAWLNRQTKQWLAKRVPERKQHEQEKPKRGTDGPDRQGGDAATAE